MNWILAALISYFLGGINTAILVSRWRGKDIRRMGSGNAGASNVMRVYGTMPALLTALGDLLKTALAIVLVRLLLAETAGHLTWDPGYFAGFMVMLGHIYPVWFRFRGGKGVMAAVTVILLLNPLLFLIELAVAVLVYLWRRTMSVVSLIAAALLPVLTVGLELLRPPFSFGNVVFTMLYAILVGWSHRDNIRRLRSGTERALVSPAVGASGKRRRNH